MVKCILAALIMVFAILGICEVIYFIRSIFLIPSVKFKTSAIVVLKPECFVEQIRFLQAKYRWYGHSFANDIFFIIDDLNEDQRKVCLEYSGNGYHFCEIGDVTHLINIIEMRDF